MKNILIMTMLALVAVCMLFPEPTTAGGSKIIKHTSAWRDTLIDSDTTASTRQTAIDMRKLPFANVYLRMTVDSLDSASYDNGEGDQDPADTLFGMYATKLHANASWTSWSKPCTLLAAGQTAARVYVSKKLDLSTLTEKPDFIKGALISVDADSSVVPAILDFIFAD